MSKEHSNPPFVLTVLQRMVAELRKAGVAHLHVDDLEQVVNQMGEKQSGNRNRH